MEGLPFARTDTCKWRRHFSQSRTNVSQALRERHSTSRLRRVATLCVDCPLRPAMTYTRLEVHFSRLNQEPRASVLLHSCVHPELPPPLTCALSLSPLKMRQLTESDASQNVPHASALITALQKCAGPELPLLILFRINSASCVLHTDLVCAL